MGPKLTVLLRDYGVSKERSFGTWVALEAVWPEGCHIRDLWTAKDNEERRHQAEERDIEPWEMYFADLATFSSTASQGPLRIIPCDSLVSSAIGYGLLFCLEGHKVKGSKTGAWFFQNELTTLYLRQVGWFRFASASLPGVF